mgnify:FL=1
MSKTLVISIPLGGHSKKTILDYARTAAADYWEPPVHDLHRAAPDGAWAWLVQDGAVENEERAALRELVASCRGYEAGCGFDDDALTRAEALLAGGEGAAESADDVPLSQRLASVIQINAQVRKERDEARAEAAHLRAENEALKAGQPDADVPYPCSRHWRKECLKARAQATRLQEALAARPAGIDAAAVRGAVERLVLTERAHGERRRDSLDALQEALAA